MTRLATLCTLILAVSVAAATRALAQQPAAAVPRLPSVTLPAELDRVLRDCERLWKAGDGAGLARLFTEDGFIARPGGWVRRRSEIQPAYRAMAGGDLRLRALAYAAGATVGYIVGAYGYGETAVSTDQGKFVLALRRQRGGPWMIATDLDSAIRR